MLPQQFGQCLGQGLGLTHLPSLIPLLLIPLQRLQRLQRLLRLLRLLHLQLRLPRLKILQRLRLQLRLLRLKILLRLQHLLRLQLPTSLRKEGGGLHKTHIHTLSERKADKGCTTQWLIHGWGVRCMYSPHTC